ncbi:MAG: MBL fold metallo-hydrolase [Chloroflexi bacterium]|nr:MAG: MBL fold metallo-hydrolase [Chloroflexota bacterium]
MRGRAARRRHDRADVALIANCHFHADHAGGNRHFPGAPIFVQKRELAHARATADYTHLLHVADFAGARTLIRASLTGRGGKARPGRACDHVARQPRACARLGVGPVAPTSRPTDFRV